MHRTEQAAGENKMGTMPIGKLLVNMSAPLMGSMLFQALYNVVDSIFVSRVSQNALNAVGMAFPIQTLVIAVSVGTGVGRNALLSRSLGEKNQEKVDQVANNGVLLFFLSALVIMLIGWTCARPYFTFMTAKNPIPEIVEYGTEYVQICIGLCITVFGQILFERLLQSTGRTGLATIPQIAGAMTNMILDPILIFGLLGCPRMEVKGAAVATVIGQSVGLVIGLILNLKKNPDIHLRFKAIRIYPAITRDIYRIGLPTMVMQSVSSVMNFFMNKILYNMSDAATAVFTAYFKLQSFVFMPVFGMNNALVPIISYNYGARRLDRIRECLRLSVIAAVSIMLIGLTMMEFFPGLLLSIFEAQGEMLTLGKAAFRIIAVCFPFAGFCIVCSSVFQALGRPNYGLIISVGRQLVVLIPVAYLMSLTGKVNLVWLAFPIAEIVSVLLSTLFLKKLMADVNAQLG